VARRDSFPRRIPAFITLLGGAAAWPLAARAQQPLPVIGFLHQGSQEPLSLMNAFRKGLSEAGIIDTQDVTIEDRAADGHYDRLPALAAELVEHRVAVIAANFLPAALAAKAATQTIPIVFLSGSDPIGAGLVSSINRPTGNVTGIAPMFTLLGTKNLELLHELVPKATVIGALANLSNPNAEHQVKDLEAGARILGLEPVVLAGSNQREIDSSFATMAGRRIGALVVTADGFLISRQDQIIALAARYAVPAMYPLSQYVAAGGLMSYGANLRDAFLQTGNSESQARPAAASRQGGRQGIRHQAWRSRILTASRHTRPIQLNRAKAPLGRVLINAQIAAPSAVGCPK
jgi:putative tryptophan/tyrosine transport system substrate-binding protein